MVSRKILMFALVLCVLAGDLKTVFGAEEDEAGPSPGLLLGRSFLVLPVFTTNGILVYC